MQDDSIQVMAKFIQYNRLVKSLVHWLRFVMYCNPVREDEPIPNEKRRSEPHSVV
jgi:hypothetical protein